MPKKPKIPALVISSREAMESAVADIVVQKLTHAEITAQMEQEIAAVQKRYQERLTDIGREIQSKEGGVQLYCEQHRAEEFPDKKSIDLTLAVIGFRETPYRVEKIRTKDTWEQIADRLAGILVTDKDKNTIFNGEDYIRYPEPQIAKDALLKDRPNIPTEALKAAGIRFDYEELFYISPKSQVAEASVKEAA